MMQKARTVVLLSAVVCHAVMLNALAGPKWDVGEDAWLSACIISRKVTMSAAALNTAGVTATTSC